MNKMNFADMTCGKTALVLSAKDNVGVSLADLSAGDIVTVIEDGGRKYEATVTEDVIFGHKFALSDLGQDAPVYKYGEEIGRMKTSVKAGAWIHVHNMYCDRGMK